jgi:hypothetical protein
MEAGMSRLTDTAVRTVIESSEPIASIFPMALRQH